MNIRIYPEYYEGPLLSEGVEIFGDRTKGHSRMKLQVNGVVERFYDKVGNDGANIPAHDTYSPCVFENDDVIIGLICCMDINNPIVYSPIKKALEQSKCTHKAIAVSAHMTDKDWFSGEILQPYLHGFNVILSNGCIDGPKSFISDENGRKLPNLEISLGKTKIINCGIK